MFGLKAKKTILITFAILLSFGTIITIRQKNLTKKIVLLFISPTPTTIPTLTPSPTPIPTDTPTPTPFPTTTTTPTPFPSPTPTSFPITSFETYFDEYSTQYKVSKDLLKKIAFCESGMNPGATNGQYGGMYQFAIETWEGTRKLMGADTNPNLRFGAKEAIETAAFKISRNGERAWANCL